MKRLDKLTQDESKMATAEVLKTTRGMDSNVKVLIDGSQTRFLLSYTFDCLCRQMAKRQGALCNRRSVCHF